MHAEPIIASPYGNATIEVCVPFPPHINSAGIWENITSPTMILDYTLPRLELQMLLVFLVTQVVHFFLNRLGIPLLASEIIAGFILGPMILGRVHGLESILFPHNSGLKIIDTTAAFGYAIYLFLVGVKMDVKGAFKTVKTAKMIGILSIVSPLVLGLIVCKLLEGKNESKDIKIERMAITIGESMTSVPVISILLSEIKILNSELGRLALSSATVGDLASLILFSFISVHEILTTSIPSTILSVGAMILYVIALVFVIRPFMFWMIGRTPEGKPVKDIYIYIVMLLAFGSCLYAHFFDRSPLFGVFIFGMAVPDGPPLGSALVDKFECFVSGSLVSLYVTTSAMRADPMRLSVDPDGAKFSAIVMVVAFMAKFLVTFIPSYCKKMPLKDSLAFGLIMTSKGIVELSIFTGLSDNKIIQNPSFCVIIIGMLLNSTIVPILVKFLNNPISRKYAGYQKRNIMHLKPNSELRILACVHKPENVATLIGFLNATCPTEESPNVVYVLHLIELIGRATPVFIAHQKGNIAAGRSYENIIMAFNQYEKNNYGLVTMNAFTAISPPNMMHEDIFTMALDKQTSLILLPFHRKLSFDGSMEVEYNAIRKLNCSVLETAICSIAILIERGNASTKMSSSSYDVCTIFIGGKDDREALTLAKRMSKDTRLNLTVTRFITGEDRENNLMIDCEVMLDDQVIKDIKHSQTGEYGEIIYVEEIVRDGPQAAKLVKSIACAYDLIIVGRSYGVESVQTQGLSEWSEFPELGVLGDLLASTDLQSKASVLVVQQQHFVNTN